MMNFVRENLSVEPSGQKRPQAKEKAPEAQQEYFTAEARGKKNVRRSTILLGGLFVLGLLGLWFMIKKSSPQTAAAYTGKVDPEEAQIETAIAQLTGVRSEMFSRMDEIVKKFYEFSDVQQISVDELAKDPFRREVLLSSSEEKPDTEKGSYSAKQEQLKQQTKDMQLLSIVSTSTGKCCVIDDKRLYEGDSVRGFKVRKIGDSTVLLESDGVEITLKLTE